MKEVIEQLKILNDLVKENTDELKAKYLINEEVYSEFLRKFTKFFASRKMFQLRVYRQYDKILDLIQEGNRKYNTKENGANFETLLSEITKSSRDYRVTAGNFRDGEESISLYKHFIGLNSANKEMSYNDSIETITNAGEKYLELRKNKSIETFAINVYNGIKNSSNLQNAKEQVKSCLDVETKKVLELCNNNDFLIFANYLINFSQNADGNFIEDVQNIINLSKILQTVGLVDNEFKKENYNKLIDFTNKSIKKYVKNKERQDKIVLKKIKKLS